MLYEHRFFGGICCFSFIEGKKTVRIGLVGMYASANLGDTVIQTVVMAALRSRRVEVDFVGLSPDP